MTPATPSAAAACRDAIVTRTPDPADPAALSPARAGRLTDTGREPARAGAPAGAAAAVAVPAAGQVTAGRFQAVIAGTVTLCDGTAWTGTGLDAGAGSRAAGPLPVPAAPAVPGSMRTTAAAADATAAVFQHGFLPRMRIPIMTRVPLSGPPRGRRKNQRPQDSSAERTAMAAVTAARV
jgi:hypothetical protein